MHRSTCRRSSSISSTSGSDAERCPSTLKRIYGDCDGYPSILRFSPRFHAAHSDSSASILLLLITPLIAKKPFQFLFSPLLFCFLCVCLVLLSLFTYVINVLARVLIHPPGQCHQPISTST